MKTALQKFTKVIDVRIENSTNEQSLKILKMVRKDIDMFLEIEERQIQNFEKYTIEFAEWTHIYSYKYPEYNFRELLEVYKTEKSHIRTP